MSTENKPENATNPAPVTEPSTEQVIQERMSEAREGLSQVSNIVPKEATGGNTDVSTQGGSSNGNDTNVAALKVIEASTGRKFASVEDFNKHYTGLSSLVGDQEIAKARKAAETLDKWEKQFGKATPELEKLLADTAVSIQTEQPKPQPVVEKQQATEVKPSDDGTLKRLETLEHDSQLRALEKAYPSATSVAEEVAIIAKSKGISYVKAFEESPLKQLVELKVKEESQRSPVVTPSNRTNVDYKNLENLGLKMMSGKANEADRIAFTKELLKAKGINV